MGEIFDSIKNGLTDAITHASGKGDTVKIYKPEPVNVQEVRRSVNMTQPKFAATFGISLGTLRHWERGDRQPNGPARVLLNIIKRNPKLVLQALNQ